MKKAVRSLLFLAVAAALFLLLPVFASASNDAPSADIIGYNLIVQDNVYISYGVRFKNAEGQNAGLLVWSSYQSDYTYDNAQYRLEPEGRSGDLHVFEFRNITVKQMTDDFYARAYVLKDGEYYYSQVKKYSILQYAYNKLGYTGTRTDNEDLVSYLNSMLKYGARTQTYENYHTERLASDAYSKITTVGGTLPDGFNYGLYKQGSEITLTSNDAPASVKWCDYRGSAFSRTGDATYTVGGENETLTAKKQINILTFGDSMVCGYNTLDLFVSFASADDIAINKAFSVCYNNLDPQKTTATYNLYELLNFTAMTSSGEVTGVKNKMLSRALTQNDYPIDYFIVTVSRDRSIANSTYRSLNKKAFLYIENALLSKNPNLKTVLIASPGFQDNSPAYTNAYWPLTGAVPSKTRAAHNAAIKNRCEDIRAAAQSDCSIAYVGDAFELHYATSPCLDLYTETLRHNSPAGAYLTACVLYSSVFGKTVSRIDENGFLPAEDAALLRAEADASVFGSADAPASLISPKMPLFGYSYADERFAGEEYPAHFDVLLSSALAYRQRGRFTQYDQLTTERATYTFSRRRTEPPYNRPEAATSQNKLYIDCSSFAFSTILDAFDFNIGASRSKTLTFDVKPSANLQIPFEWCATDDGALSADAATALLLSTIRPGDVLSYSDPENNDGHTMLYIGNGQFIHCTGGSSFALAGADYDFTGLFDKQEIPAAVIFDNIDVLIKTYEPRYLFDTSKELTVRLLRPVYANLTPSARAVSRMNNLSGVLVYKESSAPRGVTVNPGEDVTFTVVIKNLSNATKTVSVTETKPAELTYKTGSGTFDATVAPGETKRISYTLTVSASAAAGAVLDVQSNAFAVPLNKTEIRVANTLTASQQAGVTAALDALSAGSDYELARLYYKSAFLYNLPFTSLSDLYTKLFDSRVSGEKPYVTLKSGTSDVLKTVVPDVYGGVAYSKSDPDRPGYISDFNFVPGDLLVLYDDSTGANASIYVVTSERRFATVKNGVYTVTSSASETELLLETLMGRFAFAVLRPSLGSFENDGSSLFENDMLYEKNVVVFGDGFLTANNTGDVVRRFSEADGTALNVVSAKTFDNIEDGSGKYNLYELYNWNNTNITGHVDSAPVTRFFDVLSGSEGKIDYLWIETSRDDGTGNSSAPKTKITKAFTDLYGIASSGNAGIKISLINPAGFQDGTERTYASSYNPSGTRTGHNGLIHTMATTLSNAVGGCDQVQIGDAFEYFLDELDYDTLYDIDLYDRNKAFPSIAGSYYAACVLYSSVTGRATTGMPFYGYLDADTAVLLQGAADRFLTSANDHNASPITLAAHETTYVQRPMTLEEADPRNRPADPDPAFADDVTQYPDNYDVLLSSAYAYYARGSFVQYDNMGMDRVHRTGARRTVAYEKATSYSNFLANDKSSPEDATPQKILYTDCSAYIYSAMTDAFYYSFNFNFKNRSNAMFDDTEVMAPLTVFSWRQTTDNPSLSLSKAEEASAEMKAALHPGDIIIFTNESRDSTVGHIMLYIGNGKMLHSTGRNAFGGGENYLFRNGTEEYEMYGAVLYDNVKEVTDVGRWLCPFMNENWLCKVFRPNYGSYSPSAKATARLESLKNTIVYKETTAPEGVTVSAGGDVTFTVVVYNYGKTEQTYTITDTIPSNTTFKSKDAAFTLNGASLSASVTLAPQETARLSYTVTVNAVGAWTTIPCKSTYVNGVLLNNTRIIVAPTLLAEEQDELIYLLESRGPSASSDLALALSLYDGLTFSTKAEAFTYIYTPQTGGTYTNVVSSGDYVTMNVTVSNKSSYALATCLFGGVGHKTQSPDCYDRVKHISTDNMVAGDLLFALDNPLNGSMHDRITDLENNVRVYVYAGGGRLATVENGSYVLYSKTHSQALTESLPGHFAFFVLRPSIQGATPKKDVYSIHIWGDAMVSTNNPMDILYAMAEASGKKVRITANVYDNLGKTSTYQHYEFFNWNSSNTEMTSVRSTAFVNSITSPLDCLIMSTGRDASVGYPATKTRNLNAYEAIQDMYFEANPNGRILLSVPFPYENDSTLMAQKYVGRFTTAEQKIKIKEIAEEYEARTSGAKASLYLGDAFDFFAENYSDTGIKLYDDCGDYASIPGAYYMACLYYAAVFGESPVGIPEYGEIDRASAIILQNAAHSFFFGTDPAQVTQERAPVLRTSYKELNPKTMTYRDPKYAHEVYPAYYDELFATAYMYYAAGRAVQYDQMSLDNVTKTVRRLTQGAAPEELTPQRLTYLDCTWFVHSAYKSAVNYVLKPSLGSKVINITEGCVYRWVGPDGTVPVEDAVAEFRATLQPGDVMMYFDRSAGQGHGMLYLGNGIYIHCSSSNRKSRGSADYNFSADIDAREYLGGVDFGKLDLIIDPSLNTCFFKSNEEVSIIRPLSLGYTPTENATKRLNNLAGVVTWKETTAYRGQTVNPGDDVTFTYVLRNDNDTAKTVAIKDVLPDFTIYKSGDIAFTNGSLNTSVVVPALSERRISFTVTVLETAEASVIACDKTQFGGITHYCNPIYVARTLTPEERATVSSASVTASSATELIAKTYALIGQTVNIPENSELINSLFTIGGSADPYYYATVGTGYYSTLIPQYLTGGKNMKGELSGNRIKNITLDDLMCGDVLAVMTDNATVKLYLCLGDKSLKTVTDGSVETIVPANAATFVDKLMAKFAFAVIRPSRAFPTKGEISRLSTYNNEPLNVSFLGDAFVTQDTANYFGAFCFEGGRPINSKGTGNGTRNINQNTEYTSYSYYTTYSPYLLWDSADQPTLSPENAGTSLKIMTSPDSPPLDFFIIQSGRDRLLFNSADATKAVKAVKAIYDLLKAQNPDGELVILVPPAFPDNGQPNYYTYNMGTYNYENCKARISNLATRYASAVGNDCIMVRADEATYFFDENYGASSGISLFRDDSRTPNEAGAYFTSALMYATLLNKSPYGMEFSAYLTEDESRLLQRAAHRFVFGSDPEAPAAPPAKLSLPIFEQDSRFTHEEAPKNFEYLLATAEAYFDRHLWIQYDQLGMMRTGSANSFYRRTTDTSAAPNLSSPEAGTPQTTLYLDCTAFVWSLIKDTFNYDLPENRSKPLSYDPNGTLASMTAFKFVSVANGDDTYSMTYQTDGDPVPCTSEEAAAVFLKTLRPGDVIAYSNGGNDRGHGVIYLGNGYVMQCTSASRLDGTSADYNYDGKYDSHEGRGGIRIDKIDFMTTPGRSSFQFEGKYLMTIRVTRPDYASMTPTANAIARVKGASSDPYVSSDYYNMRHVVAYRLTSAPEGVTVNPNDTVKMTVVLKNVGDHTKIINVTDSLPSTLTLESGQNNFTVTVAPGETVTREYTVRVKPTVANGTYIGYRNMKANGLTLNDTTIGVNKTLTGSEQGSFKEYITSGSLSSAGGLLKLYKNAYSSLGISLDLTDEEALISALTVQGSTSAAYVNTLKFNTSSPYYSYAAKGLFGGRHNYNTSYRRMKYIGWQNLVCGDVIIVAARENKSGDENEGNIKNYRSYIYLGDRTFAFDEGGSLKIVTGTAEAMNILETLPGEYYFCTLRPSLLKS